VGDGGEEEDGGVEAHSPAQGHIGAGRSSGGWRGAAARSPAQGGGRCPRRSSSE
jgi:hypothetical protein